MQLHEIKLLALYDAGVLQSVRWGR